MTPAARIAITNRGVDPSAADRIRAQIALRTPERLNVTVFDGRDESDLAAALALPVAVCIDIQCTDPAADLPRASLLLRLSTATATRLDVADAFATALEPRFPHLADQLNGIRYAVQEAVGNAVIHGNLGLDGALRASLEELRQFAAAMEQRLGDPAHAGLPITIAARPCRGGIAVSVEDRGPGFHPPSIRPPPSAAAGGLGLAIIGQCCRRIRFSRGGRRITMLFM